MSEASLPASPQHSPRTVATTPVPTIEERTSPMLNSTITANLMGSPKGSGGQSTLSPSSSSAGCIATSVSGPALVGASTPELLHKQIQSIPSTSSQATIAQQFCLRWNNYQSNLTNVFDQLLQNESFVDVTLACDGNSLKAHKMVLSACSPYFQGLLFDNPCQHPIIIMKDVKWPELKAIVEFMYKGEINVRQDQIGPLLKVADMLKIRGLADVGGDNDELDTMPSTSIEESSVRKPKISVKDFDVSPLDIRNISHSAKARKRRYQQSENGSAGGSPRQYVSTPTPTPSEILSSGDGQQHQQLQPTNLSATGKSRSSATPTSASTVSSFGIGNHTDPLGLSTATVSGIQQQMNSQSSGGEDLDIKPGIAEMIREEERAKLLENTHAWLGASTSSIADSYQLQLQSMWQKCWNRNQNISQHMQFRERGPLKSWRPETMAEAILSVLKDGLSLSQAARKYDIPYPTFVLYANRVHNMLGPSIDGGMDLRPKGRGRPQRILLGIWPEEHIKGVVRTVVFRDGVEIKDEVSYDRLTDLPGFQFPETQLGYPVEGPSSAMVETLSAELAAAQRHADPTDLAGFEKYVKMLCNGQQQKLMKSI